MRAYLIDPFTRTIEAVDFTGRLADAYSAIQARPIDVLAFDEGGSLLVCDDEGLLRQTQAFFLIRHTWAHRHLQGVSVIGGRCLVVGTDPDDEWADCQLLLEELRALIRWLSPVEAFMLLHAGR